MKDYINGRVTFKLKEEHIKLLQASYVDFDENAYLGAAAVDIKRPYGNKAVLEDIHEILTGEVVEYSELPKKLEEKYLKLHKETATALQIILVTGKFEVGTYEGDRYFNRSWVKVA